MKKGMEKEITLESILDQDQVTETHNSLLKVAISITNIAVIVVPLIMILGVLLFSPLLAGVLSICYAIILSTYF